MNSAIFGDGWTIANSPLNSSWCRRDMRRPYHMSQAAPFPDTIEGLAALLRERIVFDIGQIPAPLKTWLVREVRAGRIQRTWNTQRYPEGKFMYWIVES